MYEDPMIVTLTVEALIGGDMSVMCGPVAQCADSVIYCRIASQYQYAGNDCSTAHVRFCNLNCVFSWTTSE